ncbi:hypothetical protein Anas_10174 [Armadillidium nasatum]|uniref:Uncharacterized protein n=1 Tax=Armadillidium nasatum TaxID=96803 RepID=A0A5N5TAQ1_9CRUS|nr:hypothetical protein Anas_10174 [Armadillidium nasatum]
MPFVYIGRTHDFLGKSIWEIVGSLKDYGVGRMVIKHRYKRYSEPCFMRIVSAKPLMDEQNLKGTLLAENVFRGVNYGVVDFSRVACKTDYQLIPKHEEHKFIKALEEYKLQDLKLYSPTVEMPPLFRLLAEQRGHHETTFKFSVKDNSNPRARIAKEGETPNTFVTYNIGTPVCKKLYEGVDYKLPAEYSLS